MIERSSAPRGREPSAAAGERGQSSVLGAVLLLGIVVAGLGIVAALGGLALLETEEELSSSRAQKVMTQFDSRAALVALGETGSQVVRFPGGDGRYALNESAGWMNVTVENVSATGTSPQPVMNRTLGRLTFIRDGREVAYQGGGVWQQGDGEATMISPPEFHYRGSTLTVPAIRVTGDGGVSGQVAITRVGTNQTYPNRTLNDTFSNPVTNAKVRVTIRSRYYRAWGRYFERRTDGGVSYTPAENKATVTLRQSTGPTRVTEAAAITGGSGTLQIQSGNSAVFSSYNSAAVPSTRGPENPPSAGGNGADIVTTLDVDHDGSLIINGNLTTTGEVLGAGNNNPTNEITGYLAYDSESVSGLSDSRNPEAELCNDDNNKNFVKGWCNDNATDRAGEFSGAGTQVNNRINEIGENNDNAADGCLSASGGLAFDSCGDRITLTAGDYLINGSDLQVQDGETLLLDTSSGPVNVAVDGNGTNEIQIDGGNVTVLGDGRANLYNDKQIGIRNGGFVWNRGWDAGQMWLFCDASCDIQVQNGDTTYVGAIYAPSSGGGTGSIQIDSNPRIYGGVLAAGGNTAQIDGGQTKVYYDEALGSETVFSGARSLPSIAYLHISVNEVRVEDG